MDDGGSGCMVSFLDGDGEWRYLPLSEMAGRDVVRIFQRSMPPGEPAMYVDGRIFRGLQRRAGVRQYLAWFAATYFGVNL